MKQSLSTVVDATVGDALRQVIHERALVSDVMTAGDVERIREEMERVAERAALDAVLTIERALGHDPVEMPPNNKGYDIESRTADGSLLFLEVKGRRRGTETFTVTRSAVGVGRNTPAQHILALAEIPVTGFPDVRYIRGEVPA